tara:strand:- start:93 stop:1040 length:948 start_codon:yes stop_codon:yes gene_type:complete
MRKILSILFLFTLWFINPAKADLIPKLICNTTLANGEPGKVFVRDLRKSESYDVLQISKSLISFSYQTKNYFVNAEYNRDNKILDLEAFEDKEKKVLSAKQSSNCEEEIERIISEDERSREVRESNVDNAWKVDGKYIKPECFHVIRFGDGGGAEWYKKYFNEYFGEPEGRHTDNPTFVNFIVEVGKYLNKEVPLNHKIKTGWDGHDWIGQYFPAEISITRTLEECLSEKPETKVKYTNWGGTLEYKTIKSLDVEMGKVLAPHIKKNFESIKQVEILDWGGGSLSAQDHVNIYGILELEGKKFILPLKNDVYIFR